MRQMLVKAVQEQVGRHDEPHIYAEPAGDPGLVGPGSVSWELHGDLGAVAAAGLAAIVMEILHPAVMDGVYTQSSYRTQTERRARNTFGYVMVTTFGSTKAAERTIGRVRRMHERVNGTLPDGRTYEAMDPRLIGWVHSCIPWAIMTAYDRYRRPLSTAEKDRYLAEQAVIGRLGGAGDIPETAAELRDYVEAMRPELAVTEQTREFLDFLTAGGRAPSWLAPLERAQARFNLRASMSLMPDWARRLTGHDHPELAQRLFVDPSNRANSALISWAFGTPVFKRMAQVRAESQAAATAGASPKATRRTAARKAPAPSALTTASRAP
jgi:uncharacterized protein (DUF2236 family)